MARGRQQLLDVAGYRRSAARTSCSGRRRRGAVVAVLPCGYQRTLPRSLLLLLQVSNPLTCRRYADFEAVGTLVPYGQHLRGEGSAATALSGSFKREDALSIISYRRVVRVGCNRLHAFDGQGLKSPTDDDGSGYAAAG